MKNKIVLEKAIKILEHIDASKSICKKIVSIKTDLEEGKIVEYTILHFRLFLVDLRRHEIANYRYCNAIKTNSRKL